MHLVGIINGYKDKKINKEKIVNKKGILLILDGYGEGPGGEFNAVENADTPFLKRIKKEMPNCLLGTDSKYVGLPNNTMGGSEVGHMTIGGGKIKRSMQVKVDDDITSGEFFKQKVLVEKFEKLKKSGGALHLAGLWSDKQIHSNINHCFALLKMAKMYEIKRVFVHAITDGRDTAPQCAEKYFDEFFKVSKELDLGEIATIGGRFYAMDRENNLDRTSLAIDKILQKNADLESAGECIKNSYANGKTDEFVVPKRIKTQNEYRGVEKDDLFVFFNTRGDRMKQPVKMASEKFACDIVTLCDFVKADNVNYVYDEDFLKNGLCEYLCKKGMKVLKISESTKYAHVTYFFNGGREEPFANEDRIHIVTEKTDDYALTPYMRAKEITDEVLKAVENGKYDLIVVNFSNPDMIGHTGNYDAVKKSLEFLDGCVEKIVDKAKERDNFVLMCADHGNAECMRDENDNPQTAHTLNPVKCVIIDKNSNITMHNGGLQDIAPTVLKLMNVEKNPDFEGKSLF